MARLNRLFNFATPFGGVVSVLAILAFAALVLFALNGVGFRFDPLNSAERRATQAEATAGAATTDAAARQIEAAGANNTTTRVEVVLKQAAAAEQVAFSLTSDARIAFDAKDPLDPDRVRRLRDVDQQLCDIRPTICDAHPAAQGHAGDSDRTVQAGGPPAR